MVRVTIEATYGKYYRCMMTHSHFRRLGEFPRYSSICIVFFDLIFISLSLNSHHLYSFRFLPFFIFVGINHSHCCFKQNIPCPKTAFPNLFAISYIGSKCSQSRISMDRLVEKDGTYIKTYLEELEKTVP